MNRHARRKCEIFIAHFLSVLMVLGTISLGAFAFSATDSYAANADNVYLTGTPGEKRIQFVFKYGDAILATKIVHKGNTLAAPDDPSPLTSGTAFDHWATGTNNAINLTSYFGKTLTESDIIALAGIGTEGTDNLYSIDANAVFSTAYTLRFHQYPYSETTYRNKIANTVVVFSGESFSLSAISNAFVPISVTDPDAQLADWQAYASDGTATNTYGRTATISNVSSDMDIFPRLSQGHTVSFDTLGAHAVDSVFVSQGGTLYCNDLPSPASGFYKGYTFDGWYLNYTAPTGASGEADKYDASRYSNKVTSDLSVTSDTTLYAKWEPTETTFSVTLWVEGADGTPGNGTYSYYSSTSGYECYTGDKVSVVRSSDGKTATLSIAKSDGAVTILQDENGDDVTFSITQYYLNTTKNTEEITVSGDGRSNVNIYFDRDWWNLQYNLDSVTTEIGNYKWGQDVSDWSENEELFVYPWYLPHLGRTDNSLIKMMSMPYLSYQTYLSNLDPNPLPVGGTETFIVRKRTGTTYLEIWRELMTGETTEGKTTRTLTVTEDDAEVTRTYVLAREASGIPGTSIYMDTEGLNGYHLHAAYGGGSTNRLIQISDSTISSSLSISRSRQDMHQGDNVLGVTAFYKIKDDYSITFTNLGYDDIEAETGIKYSADLSEMDPGLTADSKKEGTYGQELSFAGWYTSQTAADNLDNTKRFTFTGATMPANNLVLYAGWTEPEFTVSFVSKGVTVDFETGLKAGDYVTRPADPTNGASNERFVGWYKDSALSTPWSFSSDVITEDTNIYAKWVTGAEYSVTYYKADCITEFTIIDGQGGTVNIDDSSYSDGSTVIVLSEQTDSSQTEPFMGWSTSTVTSGGVTQGDPASIVSSSFMITSNTNLYAVYGDMPEDPGPVLTLHSKSASAPSPVSTDTTQTFQTVRVNAAVTLPDTVSGFTVPSGYQLIAWNTSYDGSGDDYEPGDVIGVEADADLYAGYFRMADVVLKSNITGNLGDTSKLMEFTITLTGLDANTAYTTTQPAHTESGSGDTSTVGITSATVGTVSGNNDTITSDASGNATFLVKMADDEVFVLNSLPISATYAVSDAASDHVTRYRITATGPDSTDADYGDYTPTIANASASNRIYSNRVLATATETVDRGDGTVTIQYSANRDLAVITGNIRRYYMLYAALVLLLTAEYLILRTIFRRRYKAADDISS